MNPADLFRNETNIVQLATGEFLYREGDKADDMYVLLEGQIDIRVGDYVKTAKEGARIGEAASVEERPRVANAVAKSACRLAHSSCFPPHVDDADYGSRRGEESSRERSLPPESDPI